MDTSEKAAYFKGLLAGLGLDPDSASAKLFTEIGEIFTLIGSELSELRKTSERDHEKLRILDESADTLFDRISQNLYELNDRVTFVEEYCEVPDIFSDDEDNSDDEDDEENLRRLRTFMVDRDDDDDDDEDEDGEDEDGEDEDGEDNEDDFFEIECPACGHKFYFFRSDLDEDGTVQCPACDYSVPKDDIDIVD